MNVIWTNFIIIYFDWVYFCLMIWNFKQKNNLQLTKHRKFQTKSFIASFMHNIKLQSIMGYNEYNETANGNISLPQLISNNNNIRKIK